ncbi:MAG: helix-turn-helix transcriptional regulator [Lachnospiraceae bacterium]|nr:helix-turn-helix transcriptional regulator [Lachnospiraceae bacterium]
MQIGKILYEMRTAQNISATDLVNGICAPSSYSEYETGKNIPDFLTVNGILERLGQGIASLSAWLSSEEISYLGWRDEVCDAIEKEDYKGLKEAIDKAFVCSSFHKKLQLQFLLYAKGVLEERLYHNHKKAWEKYREAFCLTAGFLEDKDWKKKRVGSFEVGIYCLYARLYIRLDQTKATGIRETLEQLYLFVLSMADEEQQVKALPLLVCVMEEVEEAIFGRKVSKERFIEKERRLEKTYEQLKRCRYLYHVPRIQEALVECKTRLQKERETLIREKEAIQFLYHHFHKSLNYNPYNLHGNLWLIVSMGEYLEKGRRKKGLSQATVSEHICEPENYSRLEKGKRKPKIQNYKKLTQRLELEPKYYGEILTSDKAEAHLIRMELSGEMFEGNYEQAERLLSKLEEVLEEEKEQNLQYLEERRALISYRKNLMEKEELIEELKRILSYTMDLKEVGKKLHTYTSTERNLINQLGGMYLDTRQYEKAISLYTDYLEDMMGEKWGINQRFRETYMEALNLGKCLSDIAQYQEAKVIWEQWIKRALDIGYAANLDDYVAEYSYTLEMEKKETPDKPQRLCELAMAISEMYGNKRIRKLIGNYYKAKYGENSYSFTSAL